MTSNPSIATPNLDLHCAAGLHASVVSAMTVRVLRSVEEVEEIREVWSAWKTHRDSDIDLCLSWVWAREEVIRPHVVVVYRNGRPDAMLVGRLERTRMTPKIGYLQVPGFHVRSLIFSYGGLLGDPSAENSDEIVKSIMSVLRQGEAEVASLHQATAGSHIYEQALSMPGVMCRDYLAKPGAHHFMVVPENIEQVYLGLSSGHRKKLRSEAKKILAHFDGHVEVACFSEPAQLDSVIRDVEEIAKKTYQRELGVGFEDTTQTRSLLSFYAQRGWLCIYVLYLDGAPAAFSVGSISDATYCCDQLGYDPQFRKYSVGTYLLTKMLEDFCKAGVKSVDFGHGEAEYKERFGNRELAEASLNIFAPTLKGMALNAMLTVVGLIDQNIKQMLARTNLLSKIKRLWRTRLTSRVTAE